MRASWESILEGDGQMTALSRVATLAADKRERMDSAEEEVQDLLRRHVARCGLVAGQDGHCWSVRASELGGRGLVATRAIARDSLVYADRALVQGPRSHNRYLPMCAVCHASGRALFGCDHGCGLPVCSDACQENPRHRERECAYLAALQPHLSDGAGWSLDALRALVPIRALFLRPADKRLFHAIQCHPHSQHGLEVDLLKRSLAGSMGSDDEQFMRRVCQAMDTNSFETAVIWANDDDNSSTSLRALFPLGALTNHQCVPNTRHLVNARGDLLVYATRPIACGEEITMTYTELLWDTTLRRQFLLATKHFACRCPRCSDPTEHASLLGALRCATANCTGLLLPDQPLSFRSFWTCSNCRLVIKSKQMASIRAGITTATEEMANQSPRTVLRFIQRELCILIPDTNYLMMEMMFQIVSLFGRVDGLLWQDLTDSELDAKIDYCHRLIKCLDSLGCGDCTKKGLVLYELYLTNAEKHKRSDSENNGAHEDQLSPALNEKNLTRAFEILKDDIVTPSDYRKMYALHSTEIC